MTDRLRGINLLTMTPQAEEKGLQREFRRQAVHILVGFFVIIVHGFLGETAISLFLMMALFGVLLSRLIVNNHLVWLKKLLGIFERKKDLEEFPGRGPIYFFLGAAATLMFFPQEIAYAGILILSLGDSVNHYYNRQKELKTLPWNKNKNWQGLIFGIIIGTLASSSLVPLGAAFVASFIAITLESMPLRIAHLYLNDNIFVPIVAGGVLMFFV